MRVSHHLRQPTGLRPILGAVLLGLAAPISLRADAASDLQGAVSLFEAHRFPEAADALKKIVAASPTNAPACHYLGRTLLARNDAAAQEEALKWLARAVELDPVNVPYLGIYGGAALQQANRARSITAATKGRDAMEKALKLDPAYLDAREALIQFYQRAPWPIGSEAKANAHLADLRQRSPGRAIALEVSAKTNAKDFPGAFALCDSALAKDADNYTALYQYGRTAVISGQNLERGLACLQRCLTLTPPSAAAPAHSYVWHRIGNIQEKLARPAAARVAYQTAVQLDGSNRQAGEALARLKP